MRDTVFKAVLYRAAHDICTDETIKAPFSVTVYSDGEVAVRWCGAIIHRFQLKSVYHPEDDVLREIKDYLKKELIDVVKNQDVE